MEPHAIGRGRVPVHFGEHGRPLFGWHHAARGGTWRGCGVVLVNPVGDDAVRAHRPFRHLAEALAAAGFDVLRFDLHGTGDSGGDETEPGRVAAWLGDVGAAVDTLRARAGSTHVALVGLRLGATLAAVAAAERGDVDGLVMWSPYSSGAAFVKDVTRQHKMHELLEPRSFAGGARAAGCQEALGFLLTQETVVDLAALALDPYRPAARKALVLGASGGDPISLTGCDVVHRQTAAPKFLIQIPHESTLPAETLETIVTWLAGVYPAADGVPVTARPARASPAPSEDPIVFGESRPLFGILSRSRTDRPRPAIVLVNAGTVHRVGPHRLFVGLARRWASLGFTVLRMDLSGIGDSPAADGCPENLCYPQDAVADVQEAITLLSARYGESRVVLGGLCSGADIAFQTGRCDPRVAGVVMLNPRTFLLGDAGEVAVYQRARWYQDAMVDKDRWKKVLRGEVDLKRAAGLVAPRIKGALTSRVRRLLARDVDSVPDQLRALAERGVDMFLVASEHDPGVDYVDAQHGPKMRALGAVRGFRREDIRGTDHTFTAVWSQRLVSDLVTDHLERSFP